MSSKGKTKEIIIMNLVFFGHAKILIALRMIKSCLAFNSKKKEIVCRWL